jgi:protein subunit release factor A
MKDLGKASTQLEPLATASEGLIEAQKVSQFLMLFETRQAYVDALGVLKTETDPEMRELAEEELQDLSSKLVQLEEEILQLMIPKDK